MGGLVTRPKGPRSIHDEYEPQHIAEDDFTCPVCYDLMVEPTTLTCGHSFCRHCMAQWYFESSNKECPQCRQRLVGYPQVNFAMKSTADKLFADRLRRRTRTIAADPEKQRYLTRYNILSQPTTQQSKRNHFGNNFDGTSFLIGALAAVLSITVAYLLWLAFWLLFGSSLSDEVILLRRPSKRWTPTQVMDWIAELWPSAKQDGVLAFIDQYHIDGEMLYKLVHGLPCILQLIDIPDVLNQLSLSNPDIPLEDDLSPLNLWQYKEMYFGQTMILLVLLRSFIRPALLMIPVFFSSSQAWVLVLYNACSSLHDINTSLLYCLDQRQWFDLVFEWFFFPYILVLRFIYHSGLFSTNFLSASLYSTLCLVLTYKELKAVITLCRLNNRGRVAHMKARLNQYVGDVANKFVVIVIGTVVWNMIPTFVWNSIFLFMFYVEPVVYLSKLHTAT